MVRKTSVEVYRRIEEEGLLSLRRSQVYKVLYEGGPMTGGEVAVKVKAMFGAWGHSETIRNRLTELRDMGCVDEIGEVKCPISGNQVYLYETNNNIPKKLEQKPSKKKQLERQLEIARRSLNRIACWDQGLLVDAGFDEPAAACEAREALHDISKV
jgi:hypothetical protein